jgi:membrane-bound ClpP family serine protease
MKNARLVVAIITNLLDEAIIVAFIIFGLPRLGVQIPLYGILLIGAGFLIYAVGFYTIGSRILRKKPFPGLTDMVGVEGRVVKRLAPEGFIKIQGELWASRADSGTLDVGTDVIVADQYGLKLIVRRKLPTDSSE